MADKITESEIRSGLKNNEHPDKSFLESEVLFKRLWEISETGMRLTDGNGHIITVNDAFCQIVELPREKIIGKPLTNVYTEPDRQPIIESYHTNFRNNTLEAWHEDVRVMWNGKTKWLQFSNSYLEIPRKGKLRLSLINDVSKRKKAELALAKSEERYRLLFNNANDVVFLNYLESRNKFSDFVEVNDVASKRLLYSREELLTLNLYRIVPSRFYNELKNLAVKLQDSNLAIFEIFFLTKDNRHLPFEVSAHLFEYNNRPAVLSIARDISERRRNEEVLQMRRDQLRNLASRLQKIREEERQLIAREIHDELGQVLSVLKIQVSLLGNKLKSNQPELQEKTINISKIIDQTVESVQRISAKLRPGILDELGLIAAIQWQAEDFQEKTGILCKYSLPEEEIQLSSDQATAIFRIMQETLTNVARHSGAKKVSIYLRFQGESLILEVTDNGVGISAHQIDAAHSLGLLGIKERALLLNGTVQISGTKGKGTNVKVIIPLKLK